MIQKLGLSFQNQAQYSGMVVYRYALDRAASGPPAGSSLLQEDYSGEPPAASDAPKRPAGGELPARCDALCEARHACSSNLTKKGLV
jgi:hypothetical protein